jgi:drug/metabolite transporter (DMT)-like permease
MTSILVLAAAAAAGVLRLWPHIFTVRVLLRGTLDGVATLLFTNALVQMRIADATAVINAAPIAATVLAILLLKERVSAVRWIASTAGFLGVLVVLRPDPSGANVYGLLAVGAMMMVALREVVTRGITREVPSLLVTLCSTVAVALVGSIASVLHQDWVSLGLPELAVLALASIFLFGAYHLSVIALRNGEVSLVVPFRYAIIIWSLLVGYIIWGDIPGAITLAGMVLIVGSGLVVLRTEYRQKRR